MKKAKDGPCFPQGRGPIIFRTTIFLVTLLCVSTYLYASPKKKACQPGQIPETFVENLQRDHSTVERARRKLQTMVRQHGPIDYERVQELMHPDYTHMLFKRGVEDQGYSGDCWIMAFLNVIRHQTSLMQDIQDVELSRAYIKFWSLFELSNLFLEKVITTKARTIKSAHRIFDGGIGEGGYYDWAAFLVKKYGLVPYSAMPDSQAHVDSTVLLERINGVAKRYGVHILSQKSKHSPKELRDIKQEALTEIWRILVAEMGVPPKEFVYRQTNQVERVEVDLDNLMLGRSRARNLDPRVLRKLTPQEFLNDHLYFDPDEFVVLGHFPNHPMHKKIRVVDAKTATDSPSAMFLNVPKKVMLEALISSMQEGVPVWIGTDYIHGVDEWNGVIDPHIIIDDHIGPKRKTGVPELSQADKVRVGVTAPHHAMMVIGLDAPRSMGLDIRSMSHHHVTRLLLENTHGYHANDNGYVHMSKEGFMSNAFEVVVRKDHLPPEVQALLKSRAHRVRWDSAPELRKLRSR